MKVQVFRLADVQCKDNPKQFGRILSLRLQSGDVGWWFSIGVNGADDAAGLLRHIARHIDRESVVHSLRKPYRKNGKPTKLLWRLWTELDDRQHAEMEREMKAYRIRKRNLAKGKQ